VAKRLQFRGGLAEDALTEASHHMPKVHAFLPSTNEACMELRERAAQFGLGALGDAEALELFLSRSTPRGAKTLAGVLLVRWGSLD
jgi:hypothetical protein